MKVSRDSFKNNFLKNIILRLDFKGVLDPELELIVAEAKKYLKSKKFNKYNERISNEIDLEIKNNTFNEDDFVKDVRNIKFYSFSNEQVGYTLDISKSVVCLKVNTLRYIPFEEYSNIFIDIVSLFNDKIDYFTPVRLGLRKHNFCFLKHVEYLNNFFSETFFENSSILNGSTNMIVEKRKILELEDKIIKMNVWTAIQKGIVNNEELSKIIIDLDVYMNEQSEIETKLFENKSIDDINDVVFDVYKQSLTESFIKELMQEDYCFDDDIRGIESNEG